MPPTPTPCTQAGVRGWARLPELPRAGEGQDRQACTGNIPRGVPKQTAIKQTANEDAIRTPAKYVPKACVSACAQGEGKDRVGGNFKLKGNFFFKQQQKNCLAILLVTKLTHKVTQSKHCFEGREVC